MEAAEEKELLLQLQSGDQIAFNVIYDKYKTALASRLYQIFKIDELVEDTLQELFFRVWEKRESIDPEQPIVGYLFRIATNLSYDHFRKLAREQKAITQSDYAQGEDNLDYQHQLDAVLYELIDKLPQQRKKVFLLCKFENKTYDEVSMLLNISTHAVKDHIVKANKFLKEHYQSATPIATYIIAVQLFKDFL